MNEFETYEYVIGQKKTGAVKLRRLLLVVLYIGFAFVMLSLAMLIPASAAIVSLTPFGLALLVFLTWRYTSVEYEYSVTSGEVTVSKIYGGRSRRVVAEFRLRDCSMIAPAWDRLWKEQAEAFDASSRVKALSAPDAPDTYFAAYETRDGEKGIVYFEATQKMLRICHFYNASATVLTKVSR